MKQMKHEEEIKRKLKRSILGIAIMLGGAFIILKFFAPDIGSLFGIISQVSRPKVKEDTSAPPPPFFYNSPTKTNSTNLELKGFSEPESTVYIYVNGPLAGTAKTDASGTFVFSNVSLIDGNNIISAKAEDSFQNVSVNSQTLEIVHDTKKPKITITEPKDNATVRNLDQRILVKGTLDERCEVRINDKLAIIKPDNSFELLIGATAGTIEIKIEAVDEAGNKSNESIKVKYVRAGI